MFELTPDLPPHNASDPLYLGLDVGSTTVKAVVMDAADRVLAKVYRRHNARQPEVVREFLVEIERLFPNRTIRGYITGSGGRGVAHLVNAMFVQEVNAVTYAVERLHPDTGSVIELGGQDAKVIIWKTDENGLKSTLTSMNDKCAGGTGATFDRILAKTGMHPDDASRVRAEGKTVHHIAAKCGVFAETDVVGLLKAGVDQSEIVVSVCTAIAKQNLEVLVRGNVLRDKVLLLGGPHRYLPALADVWRRHIPLTWELHRWTPAARPVEELILAPPDAQYFAAIGAVMFGRESENLFAAFHHGAEHDNTFHGVGDLDAYISHGRLVKLESSGAVREGLVKSAQELADFGARHAIPPFTQPQYARGTRVRGYVGVDGGSTSSKMVLVDEEGGLVYRDYVLSKGNPIIDVREMFGRMGAWARDRSIELEVLGTAVTGYASSILTEAFSFDVSVVETVAHMRSAVTYYGDIDIICDVGGQDIKVLFMKHGRVADFKLNTQCSAGNGFFLQSMADQFGVPIQEYAARAFTATKAPAFNYGCAVFMEQDRVNFQQMGWTNDEIMAGLALVLPLNIWNYVVQDVNIARFGHRIVLQGGTQKNLAAVKAQVDYIKSKAPHAEVHVHKHAEICGAIGAALEARFTARGVTSSFIGIDKAAAVTFTTRNDATTRCGFCGNRCTRTFIDIARDGGRTVRYISGYGCERGMADDAERMRAREKEKVELRKSFPDLVHHASVEAFAEFPLPLNPKLPGLDVQEMRGKFRIGIPRVLNMFLYTPFFSTYLRALGVGSVVYSDYTSQTLWSEGNKWGAIDPCFPAKVAPAHIHNLLSKQGLTHICFPRITHLESIVVNTSGNNACPIQMGTPEVVDAAFTKDRDVFGDHGITYWKPLVNLERHNEATDMLFDYFATPLRLTRAENARAVRCAYAAMDAYYADLRRRGAGILNRLVDEDRIGILMIGHPYHNDPGLNHGILEEFQMRGFPVLCIESLPVDNAFLGALFGDSASREVDDVWLRNFNRNINLKVWAAKVAARHPNLAVVDLSSFKCGFDAPTYSYIDNILDASETPHFLFHDIDQNKPRATFAIRILTIEYFLRLEEKRLREKVRLSTLVGVGRTSAGAE
jgi:activator of 2-hydroxyglutaryl-CoA dehydratase/predicted nucleotide-binding protein (sugar kinase/HSP70/actin superfamily)